MNERPVSLAGEPKADIEKARAFGLTPDEYRKIEQIIGRTPTYTELGVFSVMWSEHCSYKSSRRHLRKLPSKSELVVQGPGENAGAIDVGDGWAAVFKIESHNHPSFVEPYQGAATGVGGILRDIFTMGARPVASMNSLKFGSFEHPRTRYLLGGVVGGIGGYGNCVGVPTVAGEVMFDTAYNANILVNAFCLGLVRKGEMMSAKARGVGNPVLYVGSATGRDGIHGASMASAEFDKESEAKRPAVQVGDPFTEKLLIEACLEAGKTGAIVAIQDMGAAGLTSSSSEMPSHGGLGIELDLDQVPLREAGLTPYEILLSESQERMLIVAKRGREAELQAVFEKWDLHAVVIGRITDDQRWRARWHGQVVADIPIGALADDAPVYDRPAAAPKTQPTVKPSISEKRPETAKALRALLDSPNVASKKWVYRQYDSIVQSNTVLGPGSDAAVLRIKGSRRAMALKVDSNPRACALDPYLGAVGVVCEAARNVACAGARPVGITNCLNYGNPERPEVMWQFIRGVEGLRDASLAFGAPVVSGNVSFYNETEGHAIPPTPTIAVLGVMIDVAKHVTQFFKNAGDAIAIVRTGKPSLAASEYAALFRIDGESLGAIDLAREAALIDGLVEGAEQGLIRSAHDIAEGGLAVALAEACFNPRAILGAEVELGRAGNAAAVDFFGEGASTVILAIGPGDVARVEKLFARRGLELALVGKVIAEPRLKIGSIDESVSELQRIYEDAIPRRLRGGD
ncbi:MAG TPA: phosphoribosylformylglycinamidine synthase subunit PurL [Candidatus Binatus sp.]|uniref:phosphoribosylformylglycinamidine synthase subunit PurL n=1 Tax=Candidatus Binatus sp. TaxID=2811406 RepID=UPI002B471F41|nr:phosphoribosylformylglycinamidine synthase subunit PurL [Candidatus Binatus sp.]HKN11729.1 phosphoribosylformylglycinamidine synthase subunit PurL [Candidatus Binatus sp.]